MLFTACDKDCGHEFIEYDYNKALVGTWTYVADNGQVEAMVIKVDGSFDITGVAKGGSLYEEKGTIKVVNNKVTLAYNSGDVFEGRLELVAGKSLSIVLFEEENIRLTYDYCENDLSDEIIGMWVCSNTFADAENDMLIQTFKEDGTSITTGYNSDIEDFVSNAGSTYKVIGNLFINIMPADAVADGVPPYLASILDYTPNGTGYGDIMTVTHYLADGTKNTDAFLRIKQSLDLTGTTYDYSSAYVSNAKGKNEDFTMLGHTFNMANINAGNFDMMFRSELFCVDLNTNTITQHFLPANGQDVAIEIPITVEGNKVTLDLSTENPAYRKVDMYMFQDADNSQLHMYMHTNDFINYFANMELYNLLAAGEITADNTTAIEKVYTDMEARIESINVSFVFKARK